MYLIYAGISLFFCRGLRNNFFTSFIISFIASLILCNFYYNGYDWIHYYRQFEEDNAFSTPEVFFNSLLITPRFFGISFLGSVFLIYLFWFQLIFSFFRAIKYEKISGGSKNAYFFLGLLFIASGPTLFLDQIRQLVAAAFILYCVGALSVNLKKQFIFFSILVFFAHVSSILLIPYMILSKIIKGKKGYLFFLLFTSLFFLMVFNYSVKFIGYSEYLDFALLKIEGYMTFYSFNISKMQILYFLYILTYCIFYKESDSNSGLDFIIRICVAGSFIGCMSLYLPFLSRYIGYFVLFHALLVARWFSGRGVGVLMPLGSIFVLAATIYSYYADPTSPINFFETNGFLIKSLDGSMDSEFEIRRFEIMQIQIKAINEFGKGI